MSSSTYNETSLFLPGWVSHIFHLLKDSLSLSLSCLMQDKCARYWPAQGSEVYGNVQVSLLQQTAHGTYNSTTLLVQPEGGMARTVQHYRLTAWPHQGLPSDTKVVTDFLMYVLHL